MNQGFGLIGTITSDKVTFDSGQTIRGLGGVLYQAAVLCGLGKQVHLYTNLGEELIQDVEKMVENWATLRREGICQVPGPGNQVHLHYPEKGERVETLKSVVPPLNPRQVIENMHKLGMLILIINSGFDVELSDWRKIITAAKIPVWLDVHSLPLSRELNIPRKYLPLTKGKEWVEGVSFIQVNEKELSSMLGDPDKRYSEEDALSFGKEVFNLGVKVVFITLGKQGVLVITPEESKRIRSPEVKSVVDTTGCGDVFCGGAAVKLAEGQDPFTAASCGLELATEAVSIKGIEETYMLARRRKEKEK
ncbi:MAG: hypothetical protein GTN73_01935 [Candidatus Aminicenantes bacterium]|nr:hypothetical protein [Candidatus Aminicenantes bacterium]